MADLTLSSGSYCRPYRCPWGSPPIKHVATLSTHAEINVGRPVTLNYTGSTNAGQLVASTADNTFYLVGIAASTGRGGSSAASGDAIAVWEANPMVEFKAVTKGATLQSSNVGQRKKLVWDSTLNIAWVDLSASTATDWRVVVTGLIDNQGDSGGYVSFKFIDRLGDEVNSTILSSTPLLAFY